MSSHQICKKTHLSILTAFLLSGSVSLAAIAEIVATFAGSEQMAIVELDHKTRDFLSANSATNGVEDQSLHNGDTQAGTEETPG